MNNYLNDEIVSVIKQHIAPNDNIISVLMETLSLGKESIYRRLRSEVPFTFEEIVKLSHILGFSIDGVASSNLAPNKSKWAIFDMDILYTPVSYINQYAENLSRALELFMKMQHSKKSIFRAACSAIPHTLLFPYTTLSLLRHYKWTYLTQGNGPDFVFSKMSLPTKMEEIQKNYIEASRKISRTLFILDKNVFLSMIDDINYFYQRNLVSKDEYKQLRKELLDLLSFLEKLTATGTYDSGMEVTIYLSDITLDSTYVHLEYDGFESCISWTYYINILMSNSPKMCQKHKDWIELLKRYSVQITQTGEVQRYNFFKKQRALIEELLNVN